MCKLVAVPVIISGIYEQDLRFQRSRMAKAMLAAVKECIVRQMDLNILNKNGVTPVRLYNFKAKLNFNVLIN